ncbi:MAG: MATE family efflux transporter [bacterium]|nr:MATE family efflux transporter [bacterium]
MTRLPLPVPVTTVSLHRRWRRLITGGPLRRRVVALAWPAVGEQLLQMALGFVDMILVGRIGAAAITAVGLSDQLVMLIMVGFAALNVGTTALVARHYGAREHTEACEAGRQALLVTAGLGLLLGAGAFGFAVPALSLMGAEPQVLARGAPYFRLMCVSVPFLALSVVGNAIMRGAGDTRTPLWIAGVANAFHVVAAVVLIFGYLGLPRLEVTGAGIATMLSRVLAAGLTLWILATGRTRIRLSLRRPAGRPDTLRRLLRVGLPAAGEQLLMRLGMTGYARIVAGLGTAAYAAHRVALNAESLSFTPGFGFALAATTLVGQGLGARQPRVAEAAGYQTLRYAATLMSVLGAFFFLFSRPLVLVFTSDPEVVAMASVCLKIVGLAQPALASCMVMAGALRGAGDTRWTLAITVTGIWLVRIPLALLFTSRLGLTGAWVAMTVDLAVRGTLMYLRYRGGNWRELHI